MAGKAVALRGVSIALACRTFGVSETCYRYSAKLNDDNEEIADLLIGLTRAKKSWGFGLCFLYLRNVRGHRWNHKRVYRIYCELELNLRIKPRKRLKRDKPDALTVPEAPNMVWSMDFMADRLEDGRQFRLLNVLDDFNRVNQHRTFTPWGCGRKLGPPGGSSCIPIPTDLEPSSFTSGLAKGLGQPFAS